MLRLAIPLLTLFLAALPLAAQDAMDAWTRLESSAGFAGAEQQKVGERNGGVLRIESGKLLRLHKKEESELGCTHAPGAGELLALAADPFGLTFIASSQGLFVTSPESAVIDRLRLRDGAPASAPNSLGFDGRRRLWLASAEQFGVLDPSHFNGRVIEVPAAGPYRLLEVGQTRVVLQCGSETWAYSPDQARAPSLDRVLRRAAALTAGDLLEITYGDSLELSPEGSAVGGVVLRYALDGGHNWNLWKDVGAAIEPGEHSLAVVAMDRDLNSSAPFELRVRVLYPFYYRSWFVFGLAGVLALLVFGCFWMRGKAAARKAAEPLLASKPRALLSSVLLLLIALQVLAGAIPHGRGWPFIGYSMYTDSRDEGHISHNGAIIGFGKRGFPIPIPLGTMGMAADNRWQILHPIMAGGEAPREAMLRYNQKNPNWEQVVRVQVWAKRTLIQPDGPIDLAPLILSDWRASEALEPAR